MLSALSWHRWVEQRQLPDGGRSRPGCSLQQQLLYSVINTSTASAAVNLRPLCKQQHRHPIHPCQLRSGTKVTGLQFIRQTRTSAQGTSPTRVSKAERPTNAVHRLTHHDAPQENASLIHTLAEREHELHEAQAAARDLAARLDASNEACAHKDRLIEQLKAMCDGGGSTWDAGEDLQGFVWDMRGLGGEGEALQGVIWGMSVSWRGGGGKTWALVSS